MNGFEAVKIIRKLGYIGYIFGVTASTDTNDISLFKQNGVTDVIAKPINKNNLHELMKKHEKFNELNLINEK